MARRYPGFRIARAALVLAITTMLGMWVESSCATTYMPTDPELSHWQNICAPGQRIDIRLNGAPLYVDPRWLVFVHMNRDRSPKGFLSPSADCPTVPQHVSYLAMNVALASGDQTLPTRVVISSMLAGEPKQIPTAPMTRRTASAGGEIEDITEYAPLVQRNRFGVRSYRFQQPRRQDGWLPPPSLGSCVNRPDGRECIASHVYRDELRAGYAIGSMIKVEEVDDLEREPDILFNIEARVRAFIEGLKSRP